MLAPPQLSFAEAPDLKELSPNHRSAGSPASAAGSIRERLIHQVRDKSAKRLISCTRATLLQQRLLAETKREDGPTCRRRNSRAAQRSPHTSPHHRHVADVSHPARSLRCHRLPSLSPPTAPPPRNPGVPSPSLRRTAAPSPPLPTRSPSPTPGAAAARSLRRAPRRSVLPRLQFPRTRSDCRRPFRALSIDPPTLIHVFCNPQGASAKAGGSPFEGAAAFAAGLKGGGVSAVLGKARESAARAAATAVEAVKAEVRLAMMDEHGADTPIQPHAIAQPSHSTSQSILAAPASCVTWFLGTAPLTRTSALRLSPAQRRLRRGKGSATPPRAPAAPSTPQQPRSQRRVRETETVSHARRSRNLKPLGMVSAAAALMWELHSGHTIDLPAIIFRQVREKPKGAFGRRLDLLRATAMCALSLLFSLKRVLATRCALPSCSLSR